MEHVSALTHVPAYTLDNRFVLEYLPFPVFVVFDWGFLRFT
jgi:hypothetical protein